MLNGDFSAFASSTGYGIWDPGSQTAGCLGSSASPCTRTQFVSTGGVEPAGTLNVIPANRLSAAAKYINTFMAPYEGVDPAERHTPTTSSPATTTGCRTGTRVAASTTS